MNPASAGDALRDAFKAPPDSAKPRVWWHWMNGNVTQAGIRADLEWMKRVGVGGLQHFDASLHTPQVVAERRVFMSEAWRADFHFAAQEAERLGLELAIASSGGWSLYRRRRGAAPGRQRARSARHQPVGQPPDRRCAAWRRAHCLHHRTDLYSRCTAAQFRTDRACALTDF